MSSESFTIIYDDDGTRRKLCKLIFGSDGSYYVTVPYHTASKALLFKTTVNYSDSVPTKMNTDTKMSLSEAVDVASADQDRIKLSHHPDGFVQFSGKGIVSGKDKNGTIRGIGINSWPLTSGCRGPAFGLSLHGLWDFEEESKATPGSIVFSSAEIGKIPGSDVFALEGHYFPPLWRRFIQVENNGDEIIPIVHPTGTVLRLKVAKAPEACEIAGFFGFEFFTAPATSGGETSNFILSGPTENVRRNEKGQLIAEGIFCMYPRRESLEGFIGRSINYEHR